MATDLEIARAATLLPIGTIAERAGIPEAALIPFGRYKAKLDFGLLQTQAGKARGKLVLVTGISPTAAGEGKTTTTIGLGDALNALGTKTMICLREPSLGPCFGVKGGATGGGRAQVAPMEDINLHFTGDFHAITSANNLLSAMIDNHLYWGNGLGIDPRRVTWRRAMDMNDRNLRNMVLGLGGAAQGVPREDGFDITVASARSWRSSAWRATWPTCRTGWAASSSARPATAPASPRATSRPTARWRRCCATRCSPTWCRRWKARPPWCMAGPSPTSRMAATASWRRRSASRSPMWWSPKPASAPTWGRRNSSTSSARAPGSRPTSRWWWPPCGR